MVYQAASLCLSYPEGEIAARARLIEAALLESAPRELPRFAPVLQAWRTQPVGELQTDYVARFDLTRRHALYLTYWTDGDTRRRGQVLAEFKQRYRSAGFVLTGSRELPDYLPLVLEFAARCPDQGAAMLQDYRASLELLRLSLEDGRAAHAGVVAAVCDTLPGASPTDRRQAMALAASGPPMESVGLDAADPRLLPLHPAGRS